ncbi:hypothetical protein ABIA39_003532 [Nocardia sp. GAS34]
MKRPEIPNLYLYGGDSGAPSWWDKIVVDDPEAVNLHVQGIAVGDHATEQVLVFQGAEEPLDHTVRLG